jgi:MFS family permease
VPEDPPQPSRLKFLLRALSSRNYRLFFAGQLVSLIGSWLTSVATAWLVYRLTGSAFLLGLVGFAGQIPAFLLAPFAGVLVDRWRLRRTLVVTQTLAMIQSFLLAWFALRETITVHHILALSAFQGFINAFDIPARQAFVVEMVNRREDLPNAIALNSTMFNSARLLGPAVAGVVIAAVGEGWCFLADGISYFAVILALLAMHIQPKPPRKPSKKVLLELREGFTAVFGFPPMRALVMILALISLAGFPYSTLMPIFASKILHGGPKTLGYLVGASGIGALCGALFLASRKNVLGLGRVISIAAATFGLFLIAFAWSRNFYLSLCIMPITGCALITQNAACNTLMQTLTDDDKRGRVMSFFTMAFMGTAPIGSLIAGALAQRIGAPLTLTIGGAVCVLGAATFEFHRPRMRKLVEPIYVARGILPAVARGIETADAASVASE